MARSHAATVDTANRVLLVEGVLDDVPEFFTADYVLHVGGRRVESGRDGVRKFVRAIRRAFPDLQVEVEVLARARGRVAWQRTVSARHGGPFRGFSPTGRRIVWRDMIVSEFRAGLIAEEWAVSDLVERLLLARR